MDETTASGVIPDSRDEFNSEDSDFGWDMGNALAFAPLRLVAPPAVLTSDAHGDVMLSEHLHGQRWRLRKLLSAMLSQIKYVPVGAHQIMKAPMRYEGILRHADW